MPSHQNASAPDVQYMCAGARARRCWPSNPLFTPAAIYLLFILPFGTEAASLEPLFVKAHPFPVIPVALLPMIPALNPLLPFPRKIPVLVLLSSTSRSRYVLFFLLLGSRWVLQLGCCLPWRSSFTLCWLHEASDAASELPTSVDNPACLRLTGVPSQTKWGVVAEHLAHIQFSPPARPPACVSSLKLGREMQHVRCTPAESLEISSPSLKAGVRPEIWASFFSYCKVTLPPAMLVFKTGSCS